MKTSRFFVDASPALIDWVLLLANFAVFYRAGEQHLTLNQCAWLAGIWSLFYMLTSMTIGFFMSRRNARLVLLLSTAFTVLAAIFCLCVTQFKLMLAGLAMSGISTAFLFNSFQSFMRGESAPGNLMKTIGIYTLSWSLGSGIGVISSGFLYLYGIHMLVILSLVIGLIIIINIISHKRRSLEEISSEEYVETGDAEARPVNACYVWVGWLTIFTVVFVQRPLASFFPAICAAKGINSFLASLPLFLILLIQGLTGLAMIKWRHALYRRSPFIIMHALAVLSFLAVWIQPTLVMIFITFSLIGIYSGFAFFCSVYYSSNSGSRAVNVGINESMGGIASLGGLFISEWWMRISGNTGNMYIVCCLLLVLSVIVQLFLTSPRIRSFR